MTNPMTWRAVLAPLGVPAASGRTHLAPEFTLRFKAPAPLRFPAGLDDSIELVGRVDGASVDAGTPGALVAFGWFVRAADPVTIERMRAGELVPGFSITHDEHELALDRAGGHVAAAGRLMAVTLMPAEMCDWPGVARFEVTR